MQLGALEDLRQVARLGELGEAVHVEQLRGAAAGDERSVRRGGDVRDLLQQRDVLRMAAELVVADEHAERVAAEGAVFFLVDLLEEGALVELGGLLEVLEQLLLGDVQDADLEARAGLGVHARGSAGRARSLRALEVGVVQDLVELRLRSARRSRDAGVDDGLGVLG